MGEMLKFSQGKSRTKVIVIAGTVVVVLAVLLGVAIGVPLSYTSADSIAARVKKVLSEVPLIDGHNDLPWQIFKHSHNDFSKVDLSRENAMKEAWNLTQTDWPRMRAGQVGAQFWSLYVHCSAQHLDVVRQCVEQADTVRRLVDAYPDDLRFVTTADGIVDAFKDGKIGSLIGMEGGHCIDSSLGTLRMFYQMGVRYMTLTHNCNTPWADNNICDAPNSTHKCQSGGLTDFGKTVVREMNRLGMFVDISHASYHQMSAVLDTTRAPVIFSHSSVYSLCNHHRNVKDEILKKLAKNGGVIMITYVPSFITCPPGWVEGTKSNISHVADHIEHARDIAGIDHVGLGSDYDGIESTPEGLEDVSTYPSLFAELVRRGWSDSDLKKLAGENLLRAMRKMEKVKENLKDEKPSDAYLPESKLNMTCRSPWPNGVIV